MLLHFIAYAREKEIGGSGGSLGSPGPLLMHLHTVYMLYSECLPTRLKPLAERTCFSQAYARGAAGIAELPGNAAAAGYSAAAEASAAQLE
jgi:hypothetical protein